MPHSNNRATVVAITVMFSVVIIGYILLYAIDPAHADNNVIILVGLLPPTITSITILSAQGRIKEKLDAVEGNTQRVLNGEMEGKIEKVLERVLNELPAE